MLTAAVSPRQEATTDHRQQRGVDEAEAAAVHGEARSPEAAVVVPPQRRGHRVRSAAEKLCMEPNCSTTC